MKGLLLKDFCISKLQKTFIILIVIMGAVFTYLWKSPSYMVSFLTFIATLFVLTTISYDEFDNGYSFLFTLPVSRKLYVTEKYVFALLLGAGIWCITTALAAVYVAVTGAAELNTDWIMSYIIYLGFVLLIVAVTVPVQLKFGGEKGRIAMIIVLGGMFLAGWVIVKGLKKIGMDVEAVLDKTSSMGIAVFLGIWFVIFCIILFISFGVSVKIMERKEF
ncbi:ABC-2 transporter permease [Mediterraneibacter sp. NSJ-55]|uniref:ABC-2 transporter permease n=1 Tax=Mediterraneibacter hominis TaxID=2763054 RepID=A0A923RNL3_9FIRM|nr:ABC-2 transporter permease [Mediterraneibacter hominis]MBC5687496.1 ABC-2 transporter permease [Mediterraneibacter hominis]